MRALPWLVFVGLAACSLDAFDDYAPGGADQLPVSGSGPFAKLAFDLDSPVDEPFVLSDPAADLADPTIVVLPDGGLRVWFTRRAVDGDTAQIAVAELGELAELPRREPEVVLAADATWEHDSVSRPSVIELGDDRLAMYSEAGGPTPGIGRAESSDGGTTWTKDAEPVLLDATSPAAVRWVDDEIVLYVTRPGRPGIHLARAADGRSFVFGDPIIRPRPEDEDAFDPDAVGDPGALVVATLDAASPARVALYVTGQRDVAGEPITSIGWAGSFDATRFDRPSSEPVLDGDAPSEGGAAVVLFPTRGVMLFHESYRGRSAIAAAIDQR